MRNRYRLVTVSIIGIAIIISLALFRPFPRQTLDQEANDLPPSFLSQTTQGQQPTDSIEAVARVVEMVTVLPRDAIEAVWAPEVIGRNEAERQLSGSELVIGVSVNGEHRAYPVALLSRHEIVNDELGGSLIAVT